MTPLAAPSRSRRRLRRRWIIVGLIALGLVLVSAVVVFGTQSGPPPLALPTTAAEPPTGSLEGHWTVTSGSMAGFRLVQTFLGMHADVVGRTTAVSGATDVVDGQVTAASFTVDLATLTVNGKTPPQLAASLDSAVDPLATVALSGPLALPATVGTGGVGTATAAGTLTLHGVAHPVTISLELRRNGPEIEAVGSMAVALADWAVEGPPGYGALGSLSDNGIAEFLLILRKAGA
jgi:polyisoprenoid-binding protein YceI